MLNSPFQSLTKRKINLYIVLFSMLTVACFSVLNYLDSYLINESCSLGIISFEFAKELAVAQQMLAAWSYEARIAAAVSTGFDYLFLSVYSMLIAIIIHRFIYRLNQTSFVYRIGVVLVYLTFVAGIFDAIENIGIIQLLLGNETQFWTSVTYNFAFAKFLLLAINLAFLIANLIGVVVVRK